MGNNILTKELLLKSVEEWNAARRAYPDIRPDLSCENLNAAKLNGANLDGADLSEADLSKADLMEAHLSGADLHKTFLWDAILKRADLSRTNLIHAHLSGADLSGSNLFGGNLSFSELDNANLREACLSWVDLNGADLSGANLTGAIAGHTLFGAVDLSEVIGLESMWHHVPSTIGIDTLFASKGNIPEVFLRGCGVPDSFIEYARSLTAKAFDYYSCFISHSTADKNFADRLYADLQAKGVRCWYAPHDMEGGEHIDTQIDRAIKVHEKLLLVLSESSINSNWVKREISKAVNREDKEGKRVLFPISLVEFSKIEEWEFVDSKGRDLSEEIRKFYIPSFKGWEHDNAIYTTEFPKLLKAFQDNSKL